LRRLRLVASAQIPLALPETGSHHAWWSLPEGTQATVLSLLARMIAKGVVDEDGDDIGT
jgi:hypothetical protein